jgi:predicted glycoside hydrolase/deacetylase ChbG (UPF0249 family)
MSDRRSLIVNADDLGQSHGVNRGIFESFERGVLTSASLMVRWPAATEAAAYARANPLLGVGLHLDLGEWTHESGEWRQRYQVVDLEDAAAVREEIGRQLAAARELLGAEPTHIDSHQHTHRDEPVRSVLLEMAHDLGLPVRHFEPGVEYCGGFHGQADDGSPFPAGITAETLLRLIGELNDGVTEIACHPGYAEDLDSTYRDERAAEVSALCDLRVRDAIETSGIELISFREVRER